MAKAFRIMGIPCSDRRETMEGFARSVEEVHAGSSPKLEKHAGHILILGEMVGVPSHPDRICALLPAATRKVYETISRKVRPSAPRRVFSRLAGRLLMPRALGSPREAVPVEE
jgi:hypothetical protein